MQEDSSREVRDASFVTVCEGVGIVDATVIMPVYRQAAYVRAAVMSVLDQLDAHCEIIISDDASGDGTYEAAHAAVRDRLREGPIAHRVVMRRGASRLGRDHIHTLAGAANGSIVVQAHGDDIARPTRVRRCIDLLEDTGASMAFSDWDDIDERGAVLRRRNAARSSVTMMDGTVACDGARTVISAGMAWKPQDIARFGPLETSKVPVGHGHVMAFRAFLANGVALTSESLFARRGHDGSWNRRLVDHTTQQSEDFGWGLLRLSLNSTLMGELCSAIDAGLVNAGAAHAISPRLEHNLAEYLTVTLRSYGELSARGMQPLWVDDELIALASQGALADRLRRRARALAPVREAVRSGRRVRASIRARWPK